MADHILSTSTSPDGQTRVLIVRRSDGAFSYRIQGRENPRYKNWGDSPWPDGFEREAGWNPPGPCCGIYDTAETAAWEALCRVEWLSEIMRPN
jgi:hypothetical protein